MAIVASQAERVGSRAFRTLHDARDLEIPDSPQLFEAWQIDNSLANSKQYGWFRGIRLGRSEDGTLVASLQTPPHGLRRAVLSRQGQAGHPASMITGASLGYAA